ncbi:uncharacterized protein LOC113342264 [Papaver somniferum]|uniref:uncharacterized protein LOC113342264 n=1 Tax=Papaver somniferum TaxID=3469 RepID=UPI000E700FE7|nr:uncharacterized protein LOC113342264 [Papaver somniferum]
MSTFKALYGYNPPHLAFPLHFDTTVEAVEDYLKNKDIVLNILKDTLLRAQERMKLFADLKRTDRIFEVGDMVYLKLQPYRQASLALRKSFKLQAKYYGHFKVIQKVGNLAYKLLLPPGSRIHPVFHVSQLKKQIGVSHIPSPQLPVVDHEGPIVIDPADILATRTFSRNVSDILQLLIQLTNASAENATWEDATHIAAHFPDLYP